MQIMNKPAFPQVIVVDDDEATVEVFSEYLELNNVKVLATAHNGFDAVKIFQQNRPEIVFIDVMMPIYDGFYALEKIREIDPDVPIIMVTADLSKATEERLVNLGASKIIYKPFDIPELLDCIETYTKR